MSVKRVTHPKPPTRTRPVPPPKPIVTLRTEHLVTRDAADEAPVRATAATRFIGWLAALTLVTGCLGPPQFQDDCEAANDLVQRCGVTVPLLTKTPCTGIPKMVSTCVTEQARGCADLAALARNPDRCFPDGGALVEPEPLALPDPLARDGGAR